LIFFLVPLIEMIILIEVGSIIGALPTVGLVVLTAISGVWLLKMEGIATLTRVQEKLNRGEMPETELLEGIMLVFGGALLLTPGFVTDFAGFVCLIPGLRKPLASRIIKTASFSAFQMGGSSFYRSDGGYTINGEFEPESDDDKNDKHLQ
jgi:UPF0716 protein FxsA